MLAFKCVIPGSYYVATSDVTEDEYVIRTRPKGDGWMAINDSERLVISTGNTRLQAMRDCVSYDRQVAEAITRSL